MPLAQTDDVIVDNCKVGEDDLHHDSSNETDILEPQPKKPKSAYSYKHYFNKNWLKTHSWLSYDKLPGQAILLHSLGLFSTYIPIKLTVFKGLF